MDKFYRCKCGSIIFDEKDSMGKMLYCANCGRAVWRLKVEKCYSVNLECSCCGGQSFIKRQINEDTGHPFYCERPNFKGSCLECSLVNYGRDCYNYPVYKGKAKVV